MLQSLLQKLRRARPRNPLDYNCVHQTQTQTQAGTLKPVAEPPETEFEKNKREDRVKALNQFQTGAQEETECEIPTFFIAEVEDEEADPQPLHKLLQALESSENLENSRCEVCGKPQGACLGCCKVCKEVQCKCRCSYCHYITTEVKETEAELQPIHKLLQILEPSETQMKKPIRKGSSSPCRQTVGLLVR